MRFMQHPLNYTNWPKTCVKSQLHKCYTKAVATLNNTPSEKEMQKTKTLSNVTKSSPPTQNLYKLQKFSGFIPTNTEFTLQIK